MVDIMNELSVIASYRFMEHQDRDQEKQTHTYALSVLSVE